MGNPQFAGWFISWKIHENPIQVNDDLGVSLFQESSISNFTSLVAKMASQLLPLEVPQAFLRHWMMFYNCKGASSLNQQ